MGIYFVYFGSLLKSDQALQETEYAKGLNFTRVKGYKGCYCLYRSITQSTDFNTRRVCTRQRDMMRTVV